MTPFTTEFERSEHAQLSLSGLSLVHLSTHSILERSPPQCGKLSGQVLHLLEQGRQIGRPVGAPKLGKFDLSTSSFSKGSSSWPLF